MTYATSETGHAEASLVDSRYAWARLAVALLIGTIGCAGMWTYVVALPYVQSAFGVARADASVPFTLAMLGFAGGNVLLGRFADRYGIVVPIIIGAVSLTIGYAISGVSGSIWQFAAGHVLVGFGAAAVFGPLIADISHWFVRRRGVAVALAAAGNYVGGAVWPPIVRPLIETVGWRETHIGIGLFCLATMLPLAFALRRRPAAAPAAAALTEGEGGRPSLGISSNALLALLSLSGIACCIAMAMPQVHIVAYCGDLGYGPARGAEMLSLMLAGGLVSRIFFGLIADRVGGVVTLLTSATLQALALLMYLAFNGLASLYVVSALFGLFQGGIIPSYAIIVREYFPPKEAGSKVGIVIMASVFGMAIGGWMSGAIFDATGSYRMAFANGFVWNLITIAVAIWLILRPRLLDRGRMVPAQA